MGQDTLRDRFVEELFDWSDVLDSIEEPAAAEVWASSAVAEWVELGGDAASLASRVADRAPLPAELIDWIVSGVLPTEGPKWIGEVGRYTAQSAVEVRGDAEVAIVIEYASSDGRRHDASVTIEGRVAVGLSIGPAGLAEAVREGDVAGLEVRPLDVEASQLVVREALSSVSPASLPASSRLNLPLFLRRFEVEVVAGVDPDIEVEVMTGSGEGVGARDDAPDTIADRDPDDDRYAAELVRSSLRLDLAEPAPAEVRALAVRFGEQLRLGDPDAVTLLDVAGLDAVELDVEGTDGAKAVRLLLCAAGAYLAPRDLVPHEPPEREAILELESADWVGAILGLVRAGPGSAVDGASLVLGVNRCPEVASTIPKADAPRIAWAFELTLFAWQVTGVLDEAGLLTEPAIWLLPRAAIFAWDPPASTMWAKPSG